MKYQREIVIGLAGLFDLIVGDSKGWWHPVIGMGKVIKYLEEKVRIYSKKNPFLEKRFGAILAVTVPCIFTGGSIFLVNIFRKFKVKLKVILESVMIGRLLAMKSLKKESMEVKKHLKKME